MRLQVWAYRKGLPDPVLDEQVRKVACAESFGSGTGEEGRDVSFWAMDATEALSIKDRILTLPFITKVEVYNRGEWMVFTRPQD